MGGTAGRDAQIKEYDNLVAGSRQSLAQFSDIQRLLKNDKTQGGWAGTLVSKANNIISGVSSLAASSGNSQLLDASNPAYQGELNRFRSSPLFGQLKASGGNDAQLEALYVSAAYAAVQAMQKGGRGVTDSDIVNGMKSLGGNLADKGAALQVLDQAAMGIKRNVKIYHNGKEGLYGKLPEEFNVDVPKYRPATKPLPDPEQSSGGNSQLAPDLSNLFAP
jgi:hypothetical protein